jgi:hypothetical protein
MVTAWLAEFFQFELCEECGQDEHGHVATTDPLGLPHATCLTDTTTEGTT